MDSLTSCFPCYADIRSDTTPSCFRQIVVLLDSYWSILNQVNECHEFTLRDFF